MTAQVYGDTLNLKAAKKEDSMLSSFHFGLYMEPVAGIEPATSSLPWKRSTTEPHRRICYKSPDIIWSMTKIQAGVGEILESLVSTSPAASNSANFQVRTKDGSREKVRSPNIPISSSSSAFPKCSRPTTSPL